MDVSAVRPRSLARMTHLARRAAAACHQDRVDGLAAEFAFFGVLSTFPGLLVVAALVGLSRAWALELAASAAGANRVLGTLGGGLNGVLHRDLELGTGVAPSG
jgi:uncharacterized BrkB/YihY/UPF0761 family membrane protein